MDSAVVEEIVETPEQAAEFSEIESVEAPLVEEQPQIESELPDKFRGKSVEDIVSSYENLEKELGRKGQEIGELRKLTDGILQQQLTTTQSGTEAQEEEDTDFFDDPDLAVNKAIENHPKFREFEEHQKVQSAQATTQKLETAHPDYLKVVEDPKFQEWVQDSPIRTKLFVDAHNYDINSAMELIGNWKERSLISNTSNSDPDRYESLQDEILQAYSDGRVK